MEQKAFGNYNHILLCSDGSEFSEGAIREAIALARGRGTRLTALEVVEFNPEFEALAPNLVEKIEGEAAGHLRGIRSRAEKEGVRCEALFVRAEVPHNQITKEAERIGADLIVMGRRGRTGIGRLLMGSVTKRVIGHAPCSVLVVPRAAKILCRRILAATDGSKFGDAAVDEAIALAKTCEARLILVSAVHSETMSPLDIVQSDMQRDLIVDSEMRIAGDAVKKAGERAGKAGVAAETMVLSGRPYEVIISTAKEKLADLIVVGSHGRTGIDRLLLGSVAERVVGDAECAVLVVKPTVMTAAL